MDGERGRLVVKPVYQPKRDSLYQECLDAVPEEIKEMVSLEVEFSNFVSLVRKMRNAQKRQEYTDSTLDREAMYACRKLTKQRESEVDEYLNKMEEQL